MSYIGGKIKDLLLSDKVFRFFQSHGVHIIKNYYYSPIPDISEFGKKLWNEESKLVGLELNIDRQLAFLEEVIPLYKNETIFPVDQTGCPYEYYLNCHQFGYQPAKILHSMVRHLKPGNIIEIGSGSSTYVTARACEMNRTEGREVNFCAVEPYPSPVLRKGFPGLSQLIQSKAEKMEGGFFEQLQADDILFIDSSHICRTDSDVTYLFLEVLPRLNKGVYVHFHDIFLPNQYPKQWMEDNKLFFNEQYLLQAFLCFNSAFEVTFSNYLMNSRYPKKMCEVFPVPDGFDEFHYPSSFWIKKEI